MPDQLAYSVKCSGCIDNCLFPLHPHMLIGLAAHLGWLQPRILHDLHGIHRDRADATE
ncbi:hypothetical protein AK812_SmicGene41965, partial [Symbiodinium microadriaticum]